jgi:hypothetical protein
MPTKPKEVTPGTPSLTEIRGKVARLGLIPADIKAAVEWARTSSVKDD